MLTIISAFAQLERDIIRERTLAGLARARAWGKKLGRPYKSRPTLPEGGLKAWREQNKTPPVIVAKITQGIDNQTNGRLN